MKEELGKPEDLRTRTKRFALRVIRLYSALPKKTEAQIIGKQLLRSGTSVGAHYREAVRSRSDAEFISKLEGGLQELEESVYWMELLVESGIIKDESLHELMKEADELTAIFVTCVKSTKQRKIKKSSPHPSSLILHPFQQARLIRFDEQAVTRATIEALDPPLYQRFRTPLSEEADHEFLSKLRLITQDDQGTWRPTVAGILLATRNPRQWIPNAFIQAVCYRGTDRDASDQVDHKDIEGPIDEQILGACRFVKLNMKVAAYKSPGRVEVPQYAMPAVFEAVVNAVAHRDYAIYGSKIRLHMFADRLELFSPGSLLNTLTIDSLHLRQVSRNELLTSLLARSPIGMEGLSETRQYMMDKRGEGVPIILQKSEALSGKKPIYRLIDEAELLLTIYAADPHRTKGN